MRYFEYSNATKTPEIIEENPEQINASIPRGGLKLSDPVSTLEYNTEMVISFIPYEKEGKPPQKPTSKHPSKPAPKKGRVGKSL